MKGMKKLILLGLGTLITACAPATTIKSYVDSSLTKASLSSGGITVLPLLLGEDVKDANIPELRRELSRRTGESIKKFFPSAKVVSADQTSAILSKGTLLDEYNSAANVFDKTSNLKPDILNKITDASATRYIILPYLQTAYSTTTIGAYGIRNTSYTAAFSMIIWDKQQGKTVYEGSGKAELYSGLLKSTNILDAAYEAFDNAGVKISRDIK